MICDGAFAGLNYFFPWVDSHVLTAPFASGGNHRLSTADLSP